MNRPRQGRWAGALLVVGAVVSLAACAGGAPDRQTVEKSKPSPLVHAACTRQLDASTSGTLQSPEIAEASGLAVSAKNPGTLWINNDSGDSARLFAVAIDGALQGVYPVEGATAIDWEALALGPGPQGKTSYLYAADIGDNGAARPNVVVYRVLEPEVAGDGGTHPLTGAEPLTLTYPDGAHDAEALMVDPRSGEIFVVVKNLARGGAAGVYRAPGDLAAGSTTALTRVGEVALPGVPFLGAATAADIAADRKAIGIRTYGGVHLWPLGPEQTVADALAGKPCRGPVPFEAQGETLAIQPDDRGYFTVAEGPGAALHHDTVRG
jgi:hypothetical protein